MADFTRIDLRFADGSYTESSINATQGAFVYLVPPETPPLIEVFVAAPGNRIDDFTRMELRFADGSHMEIPINATQGEFVYRLLPGTPPLIEVFVAAPGNRMESIGNDDEASVYVYRAP